MKTEELVALGLNEEQIKQIFAINGRDIEKAKSEAAYWQQEAQKAKTHAEQQVQSIKFEAALEQTLKGSGAKNIRAVKALLDLDTLKFDGDKIEGLQEQLQKVKDENPFLFEGVEKKAPVFAMPTQGASSGATLTREQIAKMTPEQINQNWDAVAKALAQR
jgi:hypothetical protein